MAPLYRITTSKMSRNGGSFGHADRPRACPPTAGRIECRETPMDNKKNPENLAQPAALSRTRFNVRTRYLSGDAAFRERTRIPCLRALFALGSCQTIEARMRGRLMRSWRSRQQRRPRIRAGHRQRHPLRRLRLQGPVGNFVCGLLDPRWESARRTHGSPRQRSFPSGAVLNRHNRRSGRRGLPQSFLCRRSHTRKQRQYNQPKTARLPPDSK